jgi:hypothetical protein
MLFSQWWETRGVPRSTAFRLIRLAKDLRPHKTRVPQSRSPVNYLTGKQVAILDGLVARMNRGTPLTHLGFDGQHRPEVTEVPLADSGQPPPESPETYEHLFRSTQAMVSKSLDEALTMDLTALDAGKCVEVHAWLFSITRLLSQATETFNQAHEAQPEVMGLCRAAEITSLWHKVFHERLQAVNQLVTQQIAYGLLDEDVTFGPPPASRRKPIPKSTRFEVLHRADYTCQACGAKAADGAELHIDHIHPVSKGGTNDPSNLQALCRDCNLGKGARIL